VLLSPGAAAQADWVGDSRPLLGTEVSVYLWSDDADTGQQALEEVFIEAVRIDRLMSTYKDESEISKINRLAADGPVAVGEELFQLIQRSLDISVLTRGAFDITFDSVGQHYDFRARQRPDSETVEAERENIDYRYVQLDKAAGSVSFLKEGVRIKLGGIAKGYVVERGIRDPRNDGQVAISVPLADEAISTSGDYERYFDEDGVRYHHIIRPSTGAPAGGVHSATVFGPDAVITDALSTSVFVMGVDQGLTLIGTLPDYESIVIDAEGRVYYSDGLQQPSAEAFE
jgi:thiamine biosynthesis lipoprotein